MYTTLSDQLQNRIRKFVTGKMDTLTRIYMIECFHGLVQAL